MLNVYYEVSIQPTEVLVKAYKEILTNDVDKERPYLDMLKKEVNKSRGKGVLTKDLMIHVMVEYISRLEEAVYSAKLKE